MAYKTNFIEIVGKMVRADYRRNVSKNGKPFLMATFTVDVEGNQIKVESIKVPSKSKIAPFIILILPLLSIVSSSLLQIQYLLQLVPPILRLRVHLLRTLPA